MGALNEQRTIFVAIGNEYPPTLVYRIYFSNEGKIVLQ